MTDTALLKAELIVSAARRHKAFDLVLLKVDKLTSFADYFFLCSCRSSRQVQSVADEILEQAQKEGGYKPLGVEGKAQGHWVLLDFGEVIAHVFHEPLRGFYDLEGLWSEAERVELDTLTGTRGRRSGRARKRENA
ncbi:MAG: ribosome silencing factor [Thermodesulfobacteriota bacterium]